MAACQLTAPDQAANTLLGVASALLREIELNPVKVLSLL